MPDSLDSISPLDGRYADKTSSLPAFCSERSLINYRLRIECLWLIHLDEHACRGQLLQPEQRETLRRLGMSPPSDAAQKIKKIEQKTNHDVKAVEYFLVTYLEKVFPGNNFSTYIHFGLTSEDINNLAYTLMLKDALQHCLLPRMQEIISYLKKLAVAHAGEAMLSRTHGQPASPTTLGKELSIFCLRLYRQMKSLQEHNFRGKLNGATGNYHALSIARPDLDWPQICQLFVVEKIGISFNPLTTQIEDHDSLIEVFDRIAHFNSITKGLVQDLWTYVSMSYFKLKLKESEVGSSTMPQKVNPIDFENAEGNLGIANSLARHCSEKLAVSRLQRDLSDSTVFRTIGSMYGHSLIAYTSVIQGLRKLELHHPALQQDLNRDWSVLTEAVQTIMRKNKVPHAYEALKKFSRGQQISYEDYQKFVSAQNSLATADREQLLKLTPASYIGYAEKLACSITEMTPDF